MKKIGLIIFLFISLPGFNQTSHHFYNDTTKIFLTKLNNEFLISLPSYSQEIVAQKLSTAEQIAGKYFAVNDTTGLGNNFSNYRITGAYQTESGDTIYETSEIVVKFIPNITDSLIASLENIYDLHPIKKSDYYFLYETENALNTANTIVETGLVEYCHPNFLIEPKMTQYIPNDTYFDKQYYLHNTGQLINDGKYGTADADMDIPEAWDLTKGDSSIVVAVIDHGVTSNHPDLPNSRQIRLPGSNVSASLDNTDPDDPSPVFDHNHGNGCAGIIAATQDNNEGISGIAPLCKIMPVRFAQGYVTHSLLADAIIFADTNGADIMNNSWALNKISIPVIDAAIDSAIAHDIIFVCAAGNTRNNPLSGNAVRYPARYENDGVISVGASNRNDMIAYYSPINQYIDLTAPSSHSIRDMVSGEGEDVWSIDIPDSNGINPWKKTRVIPLTGEVLPNSGTNHLAYTGRFGGTSAAAPMVAGVSALMLSVNPCLGNIQVKEILENTADKVGGYNYNWNSTREGHSKELGYGRINAHSAVKVSQAMHSSTLDIYMKDEHQDFGIEPDTVANLLYASQDIWVRNTQDGFVNTFHENPVDSLTEVYVYVRVRNKSCQDANGNEQIKLYWAKAGTALSWPNHWNGSIRSPLMGDTIGMKFLGSLKAGEFKILEFVWELPNPNDYPPSMEPHHFCLLARIESLNDPMTTIEDSTLWKNVKNNNNIVWKNVSIINTSTGGSGSAPELGAQIAVGNDSEEEKTFELHFKTPDEYYAKPITEVAEILLELDSLTYTKWINGGSQYSELIPMDDRIFKLVEGEGYPALGNLLYYENERSNIAIKFHFLTEEIGNKNNYRFFIEQYEKSGEFVGGEKFVIQREERQLFYADAGADESIDDGEAIMLSASSIGEPATYKWYDENGVLFYTGRDTTIAPFNTSTYKLEVTAHADGFKDYDEKTIEVRKQFIKSVQPNPSSDYITIEYKIENSNSAYIELSNSLGDFSTKYPIDPQNNLLTIDVSGLISGTYFVKLNCSGIYKDIETITIY